MPFASTGIYTPPSGATDAAAGDIIRSATWNDIFGDLSDALTAVGQQVYGSTSVTTATYAPLAADTLLLVNRAGVVTINLPAAASRGNYPLAIKDVSGAAATNNITLDGNAAETIDGLATVVISTNYGGYKLYPVSGGWVTVP